MSLSPRPPPRSSPLTAAPPALPATTNGVSPAAGSPAQLATLLSSVLVENDILKRDLTAAKRRADRFESLFLQLSPPKNGASSSDTSASPSAIPESTMKVILDLEARLEAERAARHDAETNLRALSEAWTDLDRHFQLLEVRSADARAAFTHALRDGAAKVLLSPVPAYAQQPQQRRPPAPRATLVQHSLPSLPPPNGSRVRHRASDIDDHQPPTKRLRREDRAGRYSEDPAVTVHPPANPYPPASHLHIYPTAPHPRGRHPTSTRPHAPTTARGRRPSRSPSLSPTRSRSSSMSLDDLLLQVATDERPAAGHSPGSYHPRSQSPPDYREHASHGNGTVHQYQTHIFAPPVTGPPGKKAKPGVLEKEIPAPVPALPAAQQPASHPRAPSGLPPGGYPATNDKGQRICRQCGMAGRYKEGKCVEKWGPGPEGPGTVCDRCRKKMKRVERRGTLDPQSQSFSQPHSQPFAPAAPLARAHTTAHLPERDPHPDRAVYRSDTLVVSERERERGPSGTHILAAPPYHAPAKARSPASSASDSSAPLPGRRPMLSTVRVKEDPRSPPPLSDADGEVDELEEDGARGGGGDVEDELMEAVDAAEANSVKSAGSAAGWAPREGEVAPVGA